MRHGPEAHKPLKRCARLELDSPVKMTGPGDLRRQKRPIQVMLVTNGIGLLPDLFSNQAHRFARFGAGPFLLKKALPAFFGPVLPNGLRFPEGRVPVPKGVGSGPSLGGPLVVKWSRKVHNSV